MYAGDQHLASIVQHGIDGHRDAGYSFCVPSICVFYPRAWQPDREGQPVVFASVFVGTDDEREATRPDIGRDFVGIRLGGQYTLNEKMELQGNLSYQYSHYGADDLLFLKRRRDHFIATRLGLNYSLNKSWYVLPEIQYLNNDSTLPINDFNRWQLFVTVRNNF